ncbi:TAXI family TRAP transporter solute-binding subunit [Microbacterium sp. APC 3898]|uniref:TAXI family TRAP transporter solute-binding subunit n=1 Tax=Planococcus notacanthi TaxID=3035188 RepID=A0ABT7ZPN8_9BACL|nr:MULTISPECIES: TAXI family TRAP transporter solute-binding subunit [Terrabacteria group]MDN3428622.1 TAXI family TRAP transporter solute-binding subunit [Planococcus sp. APC 4016]MDN3498670.1 TAXI family TRAP transporter solute-binding subunit [Microbacterium sp. APC 3898]
MKKTKASAFSLVIAGSMVLAACGEDNTTTNPEEGGGDTAGLEENIVTIATGGASGPYNIIGSTLAETYSSQYGVNSRTQTTGASVENVNLIKEDKIEMAFTMSDVVSQAVEGTEGFTEPTDKISQIAALYPNYVQIVTTADSGIETFEDLRGKRIAVGDQNSGVEVNARTLLEGYGITYDDIQVDYLGYAEAADGLRAGQIDAAFLTSGLPNASLLELSETLDIRMVSIAPEDVERVAEDQSYFIALEIPADTYGNEEPVPTAAIMNALVVHSDMSEDDVYELTKTFFENLDTLENSHQAAADITLEAAQEGLVAPLHPGAQRYYDEQ